MGKLHSLRSVGLSSSLLLAIATFSTTQQAIAQTPSPCQPPSAGEYLLMVVHQTTDVEQTLQDTLPRNATTTVCNYLGTAVTRVSGFTDLAIANSWAQYLTDMVGLQAFVTRPSDEVGTPVAVTPPVTQASPVSVPTVEASPAVPANASGAAEDLVEPFPTPTQLSPATPASPPVVSPVAEPNPSSPSNPAVAIANPPYNPQPLGTGYAVLVDYANRPEVAADVRQVVQGQVGVVAYEQQPYLLASYTTDLATAAAVLQKLSDRNFSVILVDGRRAILLTPAIASD
ncbi:MAG TPA: hypothetical protein V6C78_21515 [Crinalium sp.]